VMSGISIASIAHFFVRFAANTSPCRRSRRFLSLSFRYATLLPSLKPMDHNNAFKNYCKQWPRLYNALFYIVGPALLTGLTSKKFVRRFTKGEKILHAGSGTKVLEKNCTNVDMLALTGVDVVADLTALPFDDDSFDAATSEQVFEHLENPTKAAAELMRVVRPGGLIHIATPFLYPWHPSPSDYSRWTCEGLASLFPGCAVVEKGVLAGPFSAFAAFKASFLATIFSFGSRTLQGILQYFFLILLIPVKLLDIVFARFPNAELCAAAVYVVVRVP